VSVSALSSQTPGAMELLSDVALHPAFRSEEVERIRKQRLVAILQEGDQPVASALRVGQKAVYGDLPYGFRPVGTTESVKATTEADLKGFWAAHYLSGDSALVLSGDITEADARRLAEKYFGGWKADSASPGMTISSAASQQALAPERKVIVVDKPGSPQTTLIAFGLGVPRKTPDYAQVVEMNSILGGLFSSRINMNLREQHGYTYGAFSGFSFYRDGGPFFAGAQVRTDVTAPAAKELFAELDRIHTEPATPEELKLARDNALRSLPGQFETAASQTALAAELFVYGLPNDYFQKLPASFEAVTPEAVAKAADEYVHPKSLVVVAVGDRAKIEPGLKELNLGTIELRDESGDLVKQ
jgi:zinc protease